MRAVRLYALATTLTAVLSLSPDCCTNSILTSRLHLAQVKELEQRCALGRVSWFLLSLTIICIIWAKRMRDCTGTWFISSI